MEAIKVEVKSEGSSPPRPRDVLKTPMVSSQLGKQLNNDKFADLCLVVGDQKFYANRAVLAGRATELEAEFDPEQPRQILQIDDIEAVVFFELLRFIYTGEIHEFEMHGRQLLIAAQKMGVDDLVLLCEFRLAEKASMENACELLQLAEQHDAPVLKSRVEEFLLKCMVVRLIEIIYRSL